MNQQFKEQINSKKRMATIQEELNDRQFDLKDDEETTPSSPKRFHYILKSPITADKNVYKYGTKEE